MKCNMLKSEVSAENERVKNSFSENQKAVKSNILLGIVCSYAKTFGKKMILIIGFVGSVRLTLPSRESLVTCQIF